MARKKDTSSDLVVPAAVAVDQKRPIEFRWIPIDQLVPNAWNPNTQDEITFNLLQDEIATVGLIDPIEVVPTEEDLFLILGGEHRWRAAKNLNLEEVPVIILTDEKWKDGDLQRFVTVRMNVLHGKTDPDKFIALYNEMAQKYGAESMQRLMGYADTQQFQKMLGLVKKGLQKSLPQGMSQEIEERTADIKSVQDLERIIQELFAKHGDTLSLSFMVFSYGKQDHIYLQMNSKMRRALDKVLSCCKLLGQDLNDFMKPILEEAAHKAALEIEVRQNSKVVAEPKGEW
jgi:ParB-like nuclease domain